MHAGRELGPFHLPVTVRVNSVYMIQLAAFGIIERELKVLVSMGLNQSHNFLVSRSNPLALDVFPFEIMLTRIILRLLISLIY